MCTHGTLLVCHVQVGVGLGWGCIHVSGSCTHAGCYAAATLVCELSVFYVNKGRQTACMANRVKWIRCKLQVIVDFSARFGEKNWRLDIVETFNDQLHLKTWHAVYFWKKTHFILMEKHSKINTMTTRTTNGCGYSSHVVTVDLVPARANPPGGANMLKSTSSEPEPLCKCRYSSAQYDVGVLTVSFPHIWSMRGTDAQWVQMVHYT